MSAAEKLELHRESGVLRDAWAVLYALPEIIAVVKAAENAEGWMTAMRENELETFLQVPLGEWLPVVTALDALDTKLGEV